MAEAYVMTVWRRGSVVPFICLWVRYFPLAVSW